MKSCVVGIDVGLTSVKAAAFDATGNEIATRSAVNPRSAISPTRQEIDMHQLWRVVQQVLVDLTDVLASEQWVVTAVAATGHGNGLYLVDEALTPVRPAIASTDTRAASIVTSIAPDAIERVRLRTGSVPWAGQASVLLRWVHDVEPHVLAASRWAFTCKDWIAACLTGIPGTDYSDASACGFVTLSTREYEPAVLDLVGLPREVVRLLPPLRESDEVVGGVTDQAAALTGLPEGTPVVAGCTDCAAVPLGAHSTGPGDVTVTVGTWAINSVVVPSHEEPPRVTVNVLLPTPGLMLAMEVAPTSAASIEWAARLLGARAAQPITPRDLLEAADDAPAGCDGLLFLPFVHGAPEHPHASATLLGIKDSHRFADVARAVAEGIAQYHRAQIASLLASEASISEGTWTIAGGGAKSAAWAQMFADIVRRPLRRQTHSELGARGVASLAALSAGMGISAWSQESEPHSVVSPGQDAAFYATQSHRFDQVLGAMGAVWDAQS